MRPIIDVSKLVSNQEGWDTHTRDMFNAIFSAPIPIVEVADLAALDVAHPADQYDRCLASTADGKLWFSKGGNWKEVTVAV